MLYGVGYDGNDSDDTPYLLFSVDNRDPNDTDAIQMYNLNIANDFIKGFFSSNSAENDFFLVTDTNVNYLQAPGGTFLRTYQLVDGSGETNYAATRTSSGLFVAQSDNTITKYEVAADNTSTGLSYRLFLYPSWDIDTHRTDW